MVETMATGQTDVLVVPRKSSLGTEQGLVGPVAGVVETGRSDSASSATRSRKKVTFDLDLKVRTIPNRIPVYERKPAYNNTGNLIRGRLQQPGTFAPRPLDIRGRDRYLIGAANLSAKRIIDLFCVPNGYPNYPAPPRGQSRTGQTRPSQQTWRKQGQNHPASGNAATTGSAAVRHPAYALDGTKSAKMSRAAANLKQITAALGENFDSSVYQEWDTSSTPNHRRMSSGTQRLEESPDSSGSAAATCTTINLSPSRTNTPTRPKTHFPYRHQLTPKEMSPTESTTLETTRGVIPRSALHSAGSNTSLSKKLPVVVRDGQGSMRDSQLIISKAPASQRPENRRRTDGTLHTGEERFIRIPTARDWDASDRASSRCSTIDSYVIPEPFENDNRGDMGQSASPASTLGNGMRLRGDRRAGQTGKARSTAWEGADISVTEPSLNANALRTFRPGQKIYGTASSGLANMYSAGKVTNR